MTTDRPRVLVTGLNGFTGEYLGAVLTQAGYEVHGTVRENESTNDRQHVADLSDLDALRRVIDTVAPRHVIHLAAVSFIAHDNVADIYHTNIVGTRNLLNALANSPEVAKQLGTVLLVSSANIYGNTLADPIGEDEPPRPVNDYAVSKAAMELMAAQWVGALPITIVRPFNYTGVGQSINFLIPKIIHGFSTRQAALELGNLDVHRDFSDVRDVVDAYKQLIELSPRGIFNICSEKTYTLRDIIAEVGDISGHALDIHVNPRFVRTNEVRILRGDASRLRGVLPRWQSRPFRETLQWMYAQAPR